MSSIQTMYPPIFRTEGLDRIDLIDLDELRDVVQSILQGLDDQVKRIYPRTQVTTGSNSIRSRDLFIYRVYQSPDQASIDPVVVGIICAAGDHGMVVRGDIAGETGGDVLFEVPNRERMGKLATIEAAQDIAEQLSQQAAIVALAIQNIQRSTD